MDQSIPGSFARREVISYGNVSRPEASKFSDNN
jgi:hypothetical protein